METYHAASWSTPYNDRDTIIAFLVLHTTKLTQKQQFSLTVGSKPPSFKHFCQGKILFTAGPSICDEVNDYNNAFKTFYM